MTDLRKDENVVVAMRAAAKSAADQFLPDEEWGRAKAVRFAWDWQGKNEDAKRETEVRALWSPQTLYLRFHCRFRTLTVFADSDANGRRDQLWDRDVAEVFLQTDPRELRRYWEFEVSPNGMWIDLEISPEGKRDPKSGLRRRVVVDEAARIWTVEVSLPMASLGKSVEAGTEWRVNFFRVEGEREPRFYSCWRPTHTPVPNFHVPEAFGSLIFE